jgi:hypothetical protein
LSFVHRSLFRDHFFSPEPVSGRLS